MSDSLLAFVIDFSFKISTVHATGNDSLLLLLQVLKESFKIYCAINDGIINLVDKVDIRLLSKSHRHSENSYANIHV